MPHSRTLEVRPGRINKKLELHYDYDVKRMILNGCQPSRIRRDSPAFSSDVPRNETDVPHFWTMVLFFSLPIILQFCLGTQQSDELPIKLG